MDIKQISMKIIISKNSKQSDLGKLRKNTEVMNLKLFFNFEFTLA